MKSTLSGEAVTTALVELESLPEYDGHEMVVAVNDESARLHGYIALHSLKLGPALGGTRWQQYPSAEAALSDVLKLSKAMSYKCALAQLPWGGGKAVIVADPKHKTKRQLLHYGQTVERLGGNFKTGTDVGVTDANVAVMAQASGNMLGVNPREAHSLTTSSAAALGVFYSIQTSLNYRHGTRQLRGRRIGIKGVGKLGGELAQLLMRAGAQVIAADVDEANLARLLKDIPAVEIVGTDEIHKQSLDVYSPCALGGEFTPSVIAQLQTEIIVGGANNQLPDEASGDLLSRMGILYAPDYVANSGGLIYVADELEAGGFKNARVERRIKGIGRTLVAIYERADSVGIGPHRVADMVARERIKRARKSHHAH